MERRRVLTESSAIFLINFLCSSCEACSQISLTAVHYYMKGHVIEENRVSGISKCVYDCMVTTDCLSFNFEINTNWCQLNSAESMTSSDGLTATFDQMVFSNIRDWPTVGTLIYWNSCFPL